MARDYDKIWLMLTTGAAIGGVLYGGAAALPAVSFPAEIDWPAWVQAVGSLIAVGIAIAVPAWQHSRDVRRAKREEEDSFWLALDLLGVAFATIQSTSNRYGGAGRMTLREHVQNSRRLGSLSAALQDLSLTSIKPGSAASEYLLGQTALWRAERRLSCLERLPSPAERAKLSIELTNDSQLCYARVNRMCVARTGVGFTAFQDRMVAKNAALPPIPEELRGSRIGAVDFDSDEFDEH